MVGMVMWYCMFYRLEKPNKMNHHNFNLEL